MQKNYFGFRFTNESPKRKQTKEKLEKDFEQHFGVQSFRTSRKFSQTLK